MKTVFTIVSYHRVIGEKVWHNDSTICAFKNKEDALRICAKKNESNENILLEYKYEVHAIEFID